MSRTEKDRYRSALMWTFNRLTTDGLTQKEIRDTYREIGNVLMGRSSPAEDAVNRSPAGRSGTVSVQRARR